MHIHCSRKAEPVRPSRALIGYHAVSMNSTASEVCQNSAAIGRAAIGPYATALRLGAKPPPRKLPLWLLLSDLATETRFFLCFANGFQPMPRGAEGPRDATRCRGTTRRHVVQRDRATLRGAEKPRDATWCRGTARRYAVQRDHPTSRRAEGPRDATRCRETALE